MASGTPALRDAQGGQVEYSTQGIIVRKAGFAFRDLTELTVESFDDVRRVYDFMNLGRKFIEGTQNFPIVLPAFTQEGYCFLHFSEN